MRGRIREKNGGDDRVSVVEVLLEGVMLYVLVLVIAGVVIETAGR